MTGLAEIIHDNCCDTKWRECHAWNGPCVQAAGEAVSEGWTGPPEEYGNTACDHDDGSYPVGEYGHADVLLQLAQNRGKKK